MNSKKDIIIIVLLFLILTTSIVFSSYYYILNKQEDLLKSVYNSVHSNITKITQNLIIDKQNTTLAIALALAKDDNLYNFMQKKDYKKLDYEKLINQIKEYSKYQDVWIQVVDKNARSIYRSWTDKKGDNLLFREDLRKTLKNKKISTSISVALFGLTLKARTPIYDHSHNFLGALEIITHFNSITKDLKQNNINSLVITDKKYKNILKYPYTNIFIDDYYIANKNANIKLVNYIKQNGIENIIHIPKYIIKDNYLISKYTLYDKNKKTLAYIINFMDLKNIDLHLVESFKIQTIMTLIIALIIIFFSFLIYLYSKHLKDIKFQEQKKQSILDSQSSIIVITNGDEIIDINKKFFEFFTKIKTLKDFKKNHTCICDLFIDMNDELYITKKDYNGKNWAEHVFENKDKNFRVAMKNSKDELRYFSLKTSKITSENYIIATFTDITQEILKIQKDKDKDRFIYQQSKIAAIADTLKNIAHQWRQPLSIISTIASGIKLQKQMKMLSDEEFNNSCDSIIYNTKKLSNTIENFTTFFNKDDNIDNISMVESINDTINFLDSIFKENSIVCTFTYDNDFLLNCSKNDFGQAIFNIIDNSVYALKNKKDPKNRFIIIELKNKILQIKDSAEGIEEKNIEKIFLPYFTTKHQSFGVGLGLYIVHELFVNHMSYKVYVKNDTFTLKNKKYKGANFIIDFN